MTGDYSGPMKFARQQSIYGDPKLLAFAVQPWKAVAMPEEPRPEVPEWASMATVEGLSCVRYGTDTIEYQAQIGGAIRVVENEVFWQGWTARMFDESGALRGMLYPEDVNGFRAWRLPAGRYRLVATHHTPHWHWGVAVSAAGVMLWTGLTGLTVWAGVGSRRSGWLAQGILREERG